jgi:hypothetical protein
VSSEAAYIYIVSLDAISKSYRNEGSSLKAGIKVAV